METGELLTRWTVRLAGALYVLALVIRWNARDRREWQATARLAWTMGCISFLAHIASAFEYFHGWSHWAAYEDTARRTEEVTGLAWGGGLYLNYLFAVVWLADAAWWWRGLKQYEKRPRAIDWAVQGFMAFMFFNATVVFATGPTRIGGVMACVALMAAWGLGRSRRQS